MEKDGNLIDPKDYDVVFCINGRGGRLFEHGEDTTERVKSVKLNHEAGGFGELTVTRSIL